MYAERVTSENAPTLAMAVMNYLERLRDDGITWKEHLFRAYYKFAIEGNATYARIIMDALSHERPDDLLAAYPTAVRIIETDEPLTFHSALRAFMMEQGRFPNFVQAITAHALKGRPMFGKLLEQLAQIDPPTRKELQGQVLVIDGFGGQIYHPASASDLSEEDAPEEPGK